jgi:hypothetical protein
LIIDDALELIPLFGRVFTDLEWVFWIIIL